MLDHIENLIKILSVKISLPASTEFFGGEQLKKTPSICPFELKSRICLTQTHPRLTQPIAHAIDKHTHSPKRATETQKACNHCRDVSRK